MGISQNFEFKKVCHFWKKKHSGSYPADQHIDLSQYRLYDSHVVAFAQTHLGALSILSVFYISIFNHQKFHILGTSAPIATR